MFSDIWNSYFGYLKFFFWISVKNSSLLRISKIVFQTSEIFFWISRITISDFWKRRLNVNSTCHRQHTALLKPTRTYVRTSEFTHVRTSEFTRTYVRMWIHIRTYEWIHSYVRMWIHIRTHEWIHWLSKQVTFWRILITLHYIFLTWPK